MSLLKLQTMIDSGKTWYYRGLPTVLKSFDTIHGEIEILAEIEGKPQKFVKESEERIGYFLEAFTEVPVVNDESGTGTAKYQEPPRNYAPVIYTESKEQFKTLADMLLEDIAKVRKDGAYINQAKQVCNNINAIVNITKLQMDMLKKG